MTAHLLMRMQRDVEERYAEPLAGARATHALLVAMQRAPRHRLACCVTGR